MVYFLGEYVAFPEEAYPSSQCHCGHRSVLKSFILWNSWVLWFLQCSVVLTLSRKSQDTKLALMTLSGLSSASYFCCVCYAVPTPFTLSTIATPPPTPTLAQLPRPPASYFFPLNASAHGHMTN